MAEGDGATYLLSRRCKILTLVLVILIGAEMVTISKWESHYFLREVIFSGTTSPALVTGSAQHNGTYNSTKNELLTTLAPVTKALQIRRLPTGSVQLSQELKDELSRRLKNATTKKYILVWIPMFGVRSQLIVDSEKCGNCEVTYDQGKLNDENTGAVIFHFDALKKSNMPAQRNLNQLYIYWDLESTATLKVVRRVSLDFEDSFLFNSTMTYRRESDFYMSYEHEGTISHIFESNKLSPEELLKMKTKMAVAIVSNCGYTPGARTRMRMLKELMGLGFGMEGYGGCFNGGVFADRAARQSERFVNEIRKYKFYFSFENSFHCKNYITEKYYNNAVRSLAVPVVWGAKKEDYEAVAPPASFIFAEDFPSMKELAEYLKYLDKNDTAYLEYFRWLTMKPEDIPQYGREQSWCQICRALHGINVDDIYSPKFNAEHPERPLFTDGIARRTVQHLKQWYYGEDNPECFQK